MKKSNTVVSNKTISALWAKVLASHAVCAQAHGRLSLEEKRFVHLFKKAAPKGSQPSFAFGIRINGVEGSIALIGDVAIFFQICPLKGHIWVNGNILQPWYYGDDEHVYGAENPFYKNELGVLGLALGLDEPGLRCYGLVYAPHLKNEDSQLVNELPSKEAVVSNGPTLHRYLRLLDPVRVEADHQALAQDLARHEKILAFRPYYEDTPEVAA